MGDTVYLQYNEKKDRMDDSGSSSTNMNMNMNTRRKIFHFVPVLLLPVLVRIHYQLFVLMVFGAFYLFWVVELCRYFGKLARGMDKQ